MDPGRGKGGIYKEVTGVTVGPAGAGRREVTTSENAVTAIWMLRQGNPKKFGAPESGWEPLQRVKGGTEDLTWFPLVPGGPSFPG